ncbi:GbsR/MarR family transcriptional regulator [Chloroflexota bacterium]
MADNKEAEKQLFVEEVGISFEQTGLPRMAGRIFGWLFVADSPQQSTDQIAKALLASKGSISTSTRLLIQLGLITRVSQPGVRQDYFQLRTDALRHMVERGIEDEVKMFRQLAERGLVLITDKTSTTRKLMEEMRDLYIFLEAELPLLQERWQKQQDKKGKLVK